MDANSLWNLRQHRRQNLQNTKRTACTEKQHHFGGIYLQTNKNVLDGGHEFSTTVYNQSA